MDPEDQSPISVTVEEAPDLEAAAAVHAEAATDQTEVLADAQVAVAEIEAEKEIAIAAIAADVASEEIEARSDERIQTLEMELAECRTTITDLITELETLRAQLIPPKSETLEESPETLLPGNVVNDATPASPESLPAPEPEPPRKTPKLRWI